MWFPRLSAIYAINKLALHAKYDTLKNHFPNLSFDATTLNYTPNSVSRPHTDAKNLSFGICAVCPFGTFDHEKSAHFVLTQLRTVIELPAGDTFYIPSATIQHWSCPLYEPEKESRYCAIFYSAGSNFRWVANGFKKQDDSKSTVKERNEGGTRRWKDAWKLYRTLEEFTAPSSSSPA